MPVGRTIVTSMPRRAPALARDLLAFELGHLVDVAGLERRVFVGGRMLDVSVNADRAAVHDAPHAAPRAPLRRRRRTAVALTARYVSRRDARLPVDGGDVVDDLDPGGGRVERRAIADVAGDELRCRHASRSPRASRIADERAHVVAAGRQVARQVAARETRCAGYEVAHRSATSVTGDPNDPQQAESRRADPSMARVKRREPMRLVQGDRQHELPVHRADAEAGSRQARRRSAAIGKHAIRLRPARRTRASMRRSRATAAARRCGATGSR